MPLTVAPADDGTVALVVGLITLSLLIIMILGMSFLRRKILKEEAKVPPIDD